MPKIGQLILLVKKNLNYYYNVNSNYNNNFFIIFIK